MKNKGRQWKRAEDALKKIHIDKCRYKKGYVVSVSKKHPNYFTAMIFDSWENKWNVILCAYISAYMNQDGSFVKTR